MAGEHAAQTPLGGLRAFSCRNCGGQVELLAPGQTLSASCKHCGGIADLSDPNLAVVQRAAATLSTRMVLEIGAKCNHEGKTWQVIGYMEREVAMYGFQWGEYLLFNPRYGFRFLAHAYGHWSWVRMVRDMPLAAPMEVPQQYDGKSYRFLTAGRAQVNYVIGEFYWQVRVGEQVDTHDYVAPPLMLSAENDGQGVVWSQGTYLTPGEVENLFGLPWGKAGRRRGVGANQPNPYKVTNRLLIPMWLLSIVVVIGLGFWGNLTAPMQTALVQEIPYPQVADLVTPSFELKGGTNNVEVAIEALSGLDNHWVEVEGVLHDVVNNEDYQFLVSAEYYYGVSEGERWSEGGKSNTATLNEVPPGKYEAIVTVASDSSGSLRLQVTRGVPVYSNWIMALLILSVWPILSLIASAQFEKKRNE